MSTDALELALALHQAPIQRFALRDRPLPANLDEVLQLASAMQPQLQAAAARCSETEDTIVEAVRFYLHQVLFESGADAYRILGLAPEADFKRIREHHIWLQRWLHPDRRGEDWEAALATKINWAWQQLRNEASREEYDRSRQNDVAQNVATPAMMERVQAPAWSAAPIEPARHWLRGLLIGSVLAVCVGLFYLAATRQDRVDPDVLVANSTDSDSAIRPRVPFVDETRHRAAEQPASMPATPAFSPDLANSASMQNSVEPHSEQPPPPTLAAASAERELIETTPAVTAPGSPSFIPIRAPAQSSGNRSSSADSEVLARTVDALPARKTADVTDTPRSPLRQRASSAEVATQIVPTHVTEVPSGRQARTAQLENSQAKRAPVRHDLSKANSASDTIAAVTPASQNKAAETPAPRHGGVGVQRNDLGQQDPVDIEMLADGSGVPTSPSASVQRESSAPTQPPAELDRTALQRLELARAHVRSMVGYFRSSDSQPLDWSDETGRQAVAREREVLHQRSGELGVDRFVLDPPVWQISHSAISLKTNYHIDAKRTSAESGRFRLDMVWSDDNWKIIHIELSPES